MYGHIARKYVCEVLISKKDCEFAELRLNGLFRDVVAVANLQYKS